MEEFCLKQVGEASLDFLVALTEEYQLQVAADKADNKKHVLKVVLRHLTSEDVEKSADQGVAVFLKLYKELGGELKKVGVKLKVEEDQGPPEIDWDQSDEDDEAKNKKDAKTEGKSEEDSSSSKGRKVDDTLSYHKLRQCKIHGTIGDPGESGTLTFVNLSFQLKRNKEDGYTDPEIYAAVIRAIKPGNPLRDLLEVTGEQDKEGLLTVLRAHYGEEEAEAVLEELRKSKQTSKETAKYFFMRAIRLKLQYIQLAKKSNSSFDSDNVNNVFFKALYTGLRSNNIRMEMQHTLKEKTATDNQLLSELAEACKLDQIRREKDDETSVKVSKVEVADDGFSSDASETSTSSRKSRRKGGDSKKTKAQNQRKDSQQVSCNNCKKMEDKVKHLTSRDTAVQGQINALQQQINSNAPAKAANGGASVVNQQGKAGLNPNVPPFLQNAGGNNARQQRPSNRRIWRCPNCLVQGSMYCTHCWKCGGDDHRVADCQEN